MSFTAAELAAMRAADAEIDSEPAAMTAEDYRIADRIDREARMQTDPQYAKQRANNQRYYWSHKEQERARAHEYYQAHKERCRESSDRWRQQNRERHRVVNIEYCKRYRAEHREEVRAYAAQYRAEHREELNAKQRAKYRAKKEAEAGGAKVLQGQSGRHPEI